MTFDIVEIEDCGGRILRWFDYDGELVRLLQSATPAESPLL